MQQWIVQASERGQRLDKYLKRRLPLAPSSFFYKMLRKKNITLRGKKADGREMVEEGDAVTLFLSDETIRKFSADADGERERRSLEEAMQAYDILTPLLGKKPVLYEDEHILVLTKPPGVLSQKARPGELSVNEWLRGYLRRQRAERSPGEKEEPELYTPSVCNRLDRNTGGILLCAKTLQGSRALSGMIRAHRIRKTYRMLVHGQMTEPGRIEGELAKDPDRNQVCVALPGAQLQPQAKVRHAVTEYRPVCAGRDATLVEADLITGRSHQLRVHMASIGHPIVGDPRYGDPALDRALRAKAGGRQIRSQLLWCTAVAFPEGEPAYGQAFYSPEPAWWRKIPGECQAVDTGEKQTRKKKQSR